MPRIYLDTNVFSNLRDPKDPQHMLLRDLLEKYKNNITVVFSHAHIRDKKNDPSEMKFEDFRFMETLVQDNYISYHAVDQRSSFYLATPKMVFDDEVDESLDQLLNFFETSDDDEQITALKNHLASALSMSEVQVERTILESGVEKDIIDKLLNGEHSNPSLMDITKGVANLTKDIINDGFTYKNLRTLIDNGLGQQLNEVKQAKSDLNDVFKDSFFKKTFVEFIKDSIHTQDKNRIPYYDFYVLSYNVLDILGISKDKLGKKNRYGNLLNDALHSYYARYCDLLVTNDKGLSDKSSILYQMYEVSTLIVSVEKCNELLQDLGEDTDQNSRWLFTKINYDLKHSKRRLIAQLDRGGEVYRLEEISRYFNFFDVFLIEVTEETIRYILCKSDTSYLSEPNFREMGKIIDRMVSIFGVDSDGKGNFNFVKETREDKQINRIWLYDYITIQLGQETLNEKFSLVLTLPSEDQK